MNEILREVFRYNDWATKTLIAACKGLAADQLDHPAGGFGSLIATLNHVVRCDAGYAATLTGVRPPWVADGADTDDLDQLESRANETARAWEELLAEPVDAERMLFLDGGGYACPATVVVAQAVHHANAHREQVRAGLKALDVSLPDLQPWEYALDTGRAHWRRKND